ncbi:double-strand break repair protein AddB [Puniceibacterium sp. IMCC21224]|uniref:double-strand break repair protein AddB n=1 Tax=Puniceibacterium sp. IMCC21224 TaxID=1618204 RepID=UPI00064E0A7C|nr:double-strand break repair protein AddB [Puniceibacterium sp. IMCC21224]KMK65292.1 double-strand break repair protein AddB, alphaproteobacterial type [Puniceibacterium sp. IMCC21224]
MFDPTDSPRVFGLAPGIDFPAALIDGLRKRLAEHPPEAMARVELIVNTTRMRRRLISLFDAGSATLLPRIRLLTDLSDPVSLSSLPEPVSPLRRRLELVTLIARLLESQPDLAPRSALYDLADSLAGVMDEMQIEAVSPAAIEALDVSDQSGHWQRALSFLRIVQRYFDTSDEVPDSTALQRIVLEQRLIDWKTAPPRHPVILAGSTGSRGTTLRLMQAVARLPQGAVILPGFDFDTPPDVWQELDNPLTGEDHPQFRFARLLQNLDQSPNTVIPWTDTPPPNAARNRLVSLALRPAPVTDQWRAEGPDLPMFDTTTADITLIDAPTRRDEALAIALRLREAAETGETAALITPDRMLSRQVTAALDRWDILPDDSAGTPPQLTPPGRLLRHIATLFQQDLTAEALITLLKHPLTHTGTGRRDHLLLTRKLELRIRRDGWPYPSAQQITDWGARNEAEDWAAWIVQCFVEPPERTALQLGTWLDRHIARAETIAAGSASDDAGELWAQPAGREVRRLVDTLITEAPHGGTLEARDYADLFGAVLADGEVRDRDAPHPRILIWGTLEARVMGADLLILGGLNEGSWPELPGADPWLNRRMRADAGLLLPERRIGLSAHDFQQAIGAPKVWLTRAAKSDDAETVPSRWLNRLMNLMTGLPERNGPAALAGMKARGDHWLALARTLETPIPADPAPRPSPAPPVPARPIQLSVTEIKRLIRDPYAIYARHVLRLRPLNPLQRAPDALLRGIVLHEVMEQFLRDIMADPARLRTDILTRLSADIIAEQIPFPAIRHLWQARITRIADWFVTTERTRQTLAQPHPDRLEVSGRAILNDPVFTLTAKADRMDIDTRGNAHIYDYKTGAAPTTPQQRLFDKQLLLEAAMVENGGFDGIGSRHTERATFLSLSASPSETPAPLDEVTTEQVWAEFQTLISIYATQEQGYTARRALLSENDISDYDHLARYGEWETSEPAQLVVLT